jgi:hypothetical protein
VSAPTRVRRAEWTAAVAHVPFGADGKLIVGNLALQASAVGVIRNPRYFAVASQVCLPVRSVHDFVFVSQLVSRGCGLSRYRVLPEPGTAAT